MRNLILGVLAVCAATHQASFAFDMTTLLKQYLAPCAAGFAGAAVTGPGVLLGLPVCAAICVSKALDDQTRVNTMSRSEMVGYMEKESKKLNDRVTEQTDAKLKKSVLDDDLRIAELRAFIRQILMERLTSVEAGIKSSVELKLADPSFLPNIERKVLDRVKEEVSSEFRVKKSELVRQCVDRVVNEVTAHPIERTSSKEEDSPVSRSKSTEK